MREMGCHELKNPRLKARKVQLRLLHKQPPFSAYLV